MFTTHEYNKLTCLPLSDPVLDVIRGTDTYAYKSGNITPCENSICSFSTVKDGHPGLPYVTLPTPEL